MKRITKVIAKLGGMTINIIPAQLDKGSSKYKYNPLKGILIDVTEIAEKVPRVRFDEFLVIKNKKEHKIKFIFRHNFFQTYFFSEDCFSNDVKRGLELISKNLKIFPVEVVSYELYNFKIGDRFIPNTLILEKFKPESKDICSFCALTKFKDANGLEFIFKIEFTIRSDYEITARIKSLISPNQDSSTLLKEWSISFLKHKNTSQGYLKADKIFWYEEAVSVCKIIADIKNPSLGLNYALANFRNDLRLYGNIASIEDKVNFFDKKT